MKFSRPAWLRLQMPRLGALASLGARSNRVGGATVVVELRNDRLLAVRLNARRLERAQSLECTPAERRATLERLRREGWFKGARTELMLGIGQRQLNSSPKPPVEDAEMREALRWQLRDALDYPPEEAVLDVLPVADTEPVGRQEVLVFTARRSDLATLVTPFVEARVPLGRVAAIDCAQRNLAWHGITQSGAVAMLMPCDGGALCTVSRGEQLILSRAIEIGNDLAVGTRRFEQAAERMALQMQRSFDLLERRSADAAVALLIVADWGPSAPLLLRVAELTSQNVQSLDPAAFVAASPNAVNAPDAPELIDCLHLIGVSLDGAPAEPRGSALRALNRGESDAAATASPESAGAESQPSVVGTTSGLTLSNSDAPAATNASSSAFSDNSSQGRTTEALAPEALALEADLVTAGLDASNPPDALDARPSAAEETPLNYAPQDRVDLDFLPQRRDAAPHASQRGTNDGAHDGALNDAHEIARASGEPLQPGAMTASGSSASASPASAASAGASAAGTAAPPMPIASVIESDPNLFLVTDPQRALAEELRALASRREQSAAPADESLALANASLPSDDGASPADPGAPASTDGTPAKPAKPASPGAPRTLELLP